MKGKVIPISPKEKFTSRTPLAKCRVLLEADELRYTDEEVIVIRDFVHSLAKMIHDYYMRCAKGEHQSKVININTSEHEKGDHLCESEYRRAG